MRKNAKKKIRKKAKKEKMVKKNISKKEKKEKILKRKEKLLKSE